MPSTQNITHIQNLVIASKKHRTTEDFLLYIVTEDGMLELCQHLIATRDKNEKLFDLFSENCVRHSAEREKILQNINEIVRALSPNNPEILDAYKRLGLKESASLEEVKKSFRKLSMQYHPDHSPNKSDSERFLEIRKDIKVLSTRTPLPPPEKTLPG